MCLKERRPTTPKRYLHQRTSFGIGMTVRCGQEERETTATISTSKRNFEHNVPEYA